MNKYEYEECCRITNIDNNEDVVLFDIGVNIVDTPISQYKVSLISPIDNKVVLNGFKLDNDELVGRLGASLKEDNSLTFTHSIEEFENIVLNKRYLNKSYSTLSAKSGRKRCQVGFPLVIPKSVNTQDCELHCEFISKVNDNFEIHLLITKSLSMNKRDLDKQQTASIVISFFKNSSQFIDEIEKDSLLQKSNNQIEVKNYIKEQTTLKVHNTKLEPTRVELQENNEVTSLIIEFVDESDVLLGY